MASDSGKDDSTPFGKACYWTFLVLFTLLLALTLKNFHQAYKLARLKSNSILIFYVSVTLVLITRVLLFTDVFADYPTRVYVIVLVTMPTFMYMITGLSLVLQNFELIGIFKNIAIMQSAQGV